VVVLLLLMLLLLLLLLELGWWWGLQGIWKGVEERRGVKGVVVEDGMRALGGLQGLL
jgi:hypothetical protein